MPYQVIDMFSLFPSGGLGRHWVLVVIGRRVVVKVGVTLVRWPGEAGDDEISGTKARTMGK